MKTKKQPIEASNVWSCPNCKDNPEFDHAGMMEHLRSVHKIEPKRTKGTRSMIMHLDCADNYHSIFEWTIGGLKFIQAVSSPRHKADPMEHEL